MDAWTEEVLVYSKKIATVLVSRKLLLTYLLVLKLTEKLWKVRVFLAAQNFIDMVSPF